MSRNILVTGGAGYIGSHACKALALAGYRPVVFDNLSRGHAWAVQWGPFVRGDLADRAAIRDAIKQHNIDAVIHFAAYAYVGESMVDPKTYFSNNVTNTLNLMDVMHECGVKHIVFSSTCATYGVTDGQPISECHPQAPVNPYGESKLFLERALKWYGEGYGLNWVALRYFNAAGADPECEIGEAHEPETHLIPLVIQAALRQRTNVHIFGTDYPTADGTAIRDYIHVSDLADAHVRALQYSLNGSDSQAFNLGTGTGHSVSQIIRTVEKVAGRAVPAIVAPRRAGDPPILVANPSLGNRVLGWKATRSDLDTLVTTAFRWHTLSHERLAKATAV